MIEYKFNKSRIDLWSSSNWQKDIVIFGITLVFTKLVGSIDEHEFQSDSLDPMDEFDSTPTALIFWNKGKSQNMDDSGFFSVQVIQEALKVWNLNLVPFMSPQAAECRKNPTTQKAYICNFQEHWFTIRKIAFQWFNLNSVFSKPELISETYLEMFLTQLRAEGYSIFIIDGDLPRSTADETLLIRPVDPAEAATTKPPSFQRVPFEGEGHRLGGPSGSANPDPDLATAIAISRKQAEQSDPTLKEVLTATRGSDDSEDPALAQILKDSRAEQEEADLQAALKLSMEGSQTEEASASGGNTQNSDRDTVRLQRQRFLDNLQRQSSGTIN